MDHMTVETEPESSDIRKEASEEAVKLGDKEAHEWAPPLGPASSSPTSAECRKNSTASLDSASSPPGGTKSTDSSFGSTSDEGSECEEESAPEETVLTWEKMLHREFEVACLMRTTVEDQTSLTQTVSSVQDFLALLSQIHSIAARSGTDVSSVFQALTREDGTGELRLAAQTELSDYADWNILRNVAKRLASTMRIKVQDVADVQTVTQALREIRTFHTSLDFYAEKQGCSTFEILTRLRY